MPGIQNLIQTIVQLGQLRATMDAQELAKQRFALEQRNTNAGILGSVLGELPGMQDPNAFVTGNSSELSNLTGASPELLASAARNIPSSAATQRAGAAARGAAGSGNELDIAAAHGVFGSPASVAEDALMHDIMTGSRGELGRMSPEDRASFMQESLSKVGTGMPLGQATLDALVARQPKDVQQHILEIGKGLAPSASEDAQMRLGYANLRASSIQHEMMAGLEELRLRGELEAHKGQMDAQAFKEADDLVQQRSKFLVDAVRTGQTLTPQGLESYRNQVNAYNAQLRRLVPGVYGPGAPGELKDIPPGKNLSATSPFGAFMGALTAKQ